MRQSANTKGSALPPGDVLPWNPDVSTGSRLCQYPMGALQGLRQSQMVTRSVKPGAERVADAAGQSGGIMVADNRSRGGMGGGGGGMGGGMGRMMGEGLSR